MTEQEFEISPEDAARLEEIRNAPDITAPNAWATSISPLQARNGLRAWGIGRAEVEAFFDGIEDTLEREAAQDAWEYATSIDRDNPLVAACAAFLGKSEAEVDQFFADAASAA